jgi:hypothetical protein
MRYLMIIGGFIGAILGVAYIVGRDLKTEGTALAVCSVIVLAIGLATMDLVQANNDRSPPAPR